mmetsp:Transcript_9403/g.18641  ORF Transcript_9403/g.18641 Transcript_9403/m.18641 type:complete len:358 (+) Transcript_9403:324-1397(+)|eukprot:CAMPEP_0171578924 /NCGR_PEP_ID=MMETSP0961-20121227/8147_1 /TAXON_ID=87120 /ORGANISM="Aurantiochytrium limacinum, Strain ATCCMYA-1381" /LENGTH=357 /DNA_ID=CAMNT_0012135333 /DNA_START=234 /DNA_END=1307 /DNA_ORIENTATION=-
MPVYVKKPFKLTGERPKNSGARAKKAREAAARQEALEMENIWESEAMRAYKASVAAAAVPPRYARPGPFSNASLASPISVNTGSSVAASEEDWVLVQSAREPINLRGNAHEVVLVPENPPVARKTVASMNKTSKPMTRRQVQKTQDALRHKGCLPVVTREMTDTEYNRVFKRPLTHNFGHANIHPTNEKDYMRSHNVKAALAGGSEQVYSHALDARAAGPPALAHLLSRDEVLALEKNMNVPESENNNAPLRVETSPSMPPAAPAGTKLGVSTPTAAELSLRTFGRPSKNRQLEPSMFEILSWSDPGARDVERAPLPTSDKLDPRNYATLPPSHTHVVPFAGHYEDDVEPSAPQPLL